MFSIKLGKSSKVKKFTFWQLKLSSRRVILINYFGELSGAPELSCFLQEFTAEKILRKSMN
jgi:hypothetical protein